MLNAATITGNRYYDTIRSLIKLRIKYNQLYLESWLYG